MWAQVSHKTRTGQHKVDQHPMKLSIIWINDVQSLQSLQHEQEPPTTRVNLVGQCVSGHSAWGEGLQGYQELHCLF